MAEKQSRFVDNSPDSYSVLESGEEDLSEELDEQLDDEEFDGPSQA